MSGMKLRETIRVPVRYGEDESEKPSRSFLRPGTDVPDDGEPLELGESGRSRSHKRSRPIFVQYNPDLPPAAFPSLDRPRPRSTPKPGTPGPTSRGNKSPKASQPPETGQATEVRSLPPIRTEARNTASIVSGKSEDIPMNQLENYIVSNSMDNPTYARNVDLAYKPRPGAPSSPDDMTAIFDSDDDELPDATQVLLEKIPNPRWNDLNPAMQVEIYENMMKDHTYWSLCHLLGLGKAEREKIEEYVRIRNKQLLRENNHLEQMRRKQRNALMNIDNSDLKVFEPPPQLVLKKIARNTTRRLVNKYTDLMMCQAHDVLKARQYLHRRGLPRGYAGDWGDSLVVLRESEEDDKFEPDKFEWKEEMKFTPPPPEVDPARAQALQDTVNFINNIGGDTIAPTSLVRNSTDQEPLRDWGKFFEKSKDGMSWDTTKVRDGGMVKLNLGLERAAALRHYEKTGSMPQSVVSPGIVFRGFVPPGPMPQSITPHNTMSQDAMSRIAIPRFGQSPVVMPPVARSRDSMPHFVMPGAVMPRFAYPQGTYPQQFTPQGLSSRGQVSQSALRPSLPLEVHSETPSRVRYNIAPQVGFGTGSPHGFPSTYDQQGIRPISREIPGDDSFLMSPSESQARFKRHLTRAKLEKVEAEAKAQQRFNCLPTRQVNGVGAGRSLYCGPPQKIAGKVEEPMSSELFSWEEHNQSMCANNDDWMREFIYFKPPSETKEEEAEQVKEEATENFATQSTSNGHTSSTDASTDDVMLVRTDGECSSP